MPRGGPPSYTYSLPAIYLAVPGTLITAAQHNTPLEDIATALNTAWPVSLGGTGGTSKQGAIDSLFDGTTEVTDENLRIADPADDTKVLVFDSNGIPTGTTVEIAAPNASGTMGLAPVTSAKTANYTVLLADRGKTILCDATSAAFTVTLLAAATAGNGYSLTIKKTDSSVNIVTIDGDGSETIDGATTYLLRSDDEAVTIVCNGTAWFVQESAPPREVLPRAILRYNGVADTITASFGISGVTKNSTGDYTVTFTNAFSGTNYKVIGTAANTGSSAILSIAGNMTIAAGSFRFVVRNASATATDVDFLNMAFYA